MSTTTSTEAPSSVPSFASQPRGTNTMAILSLVFAFVFWPLGIVFGHLARKQIAETGEDGHGLATAGLVISYVCAAFAVLFIVGLVAAVGHATAIGAVHGMGAIH